MQPNYPFDLHQTPNAKAFELSLFRLYLLLVDDGMEHFPAIFRLTNYAATFKAPGLPITQRLRYAERAASRGQAYQALKQRQ